MQECIGNQGKIIMVGCGKSYKVCDKITCMLNSLSIQSSKLHPVDALHGDIGNYRADQDCLVFVSASGETTEINRLIEFLQYRHPGEALKMIGVTQYKNSSMAKLLAESQSSILEVLCGDSTNCKESCVFPGLKTPTISLTLTLQLLDSLVMELAYNLYGHDWDCVIKKFEANHPNGSIGVNNGIHSRSGSPQQGNSPVQKPVTSEKSDIEKNKFSTKTFHCTRQELENLSEMDVLNIFLTNYFVGVPSDKENNVKYVYTECSAALDAYRDTNVDGKQVSGGIKLSFKDFFIDKFISV
ncbi:hypothetical protein ACO0QE_001538 [Hanseniaspora vineae]